MDKVFLRFFLDQDQMHKHKPLYEWILESAHKLDIHYGMAQKGIAGFGKKGELISEHFFELGSKSPIQVTLVLDVSQEESILQVFKSEGLSVPYLRTVASLSST